tara:strand:+ start:1245 stop:2261 length:1017 start_codon:yes stop_codon:yes gene_type:complete
MAKQSRPYLLETVNCDYCGSSVYNTYIKSAKELYNGFNDYFDVVQCVDCDFIFTNPRPTKDSMGYFYPDTSGYFHSQVRMNSSGISRQIFESVLANHLGYVLPSRFNKTLTYLVFLVYRKKFSLLHIPRYVKNGKLLDVGCSWGNYLYQMKRLGWANIYGIEPNENAVQFARNKLGLNNVRRGSSDDLHLFSENFFDVINLSMVLEHVYSPQSLLEQLYAITAPGGHVIVSVPDITGFEAKVYRDKCYSLQVPQHLNHFSPQSLRQYIERAGFIVKRIIHQQTDRDLVSSSGYFEDQRLAKGLHHPIIRHTAVRMFVTLLSMFGKTSRMTVYVRKPYE